MLLSPPGSTPRHALVPSPTLVRYIPAFPPRNASSAAPTEVVPRGTPPSQSAPATNLFPADGAASAPEGADASRTGKVPAIGALTPNGSPTAALSISYASC